jgi:hypothetical protein
MSGGGGPSFKVSGIPRGRFMMFVRPTNLLHRQWSALIVLAGALSLPGLAAGASALDQQQITLDPNIQILVGGSGPQVPAQVVTSGIPGLLTQVDLHLSCAPSSDLRVEIREASSSPADDVLASQTVSGLPDTPDWRSFALPSPPFIPAETAFAIVLSSPGSCGVGASALGENPYPRGDGWYQGPPNPPGVWSLGGHDLGFKTFVERTCQVPQLVGTLGGAAPALLERYGCSAGTVTRTYSRLIAKGEVISQAQGERTRLAAGSAVAFVVSLGNPPCRVPNVRGRKLARARSAIVRANCRVGVIRRVRSSKALEGRVIQQQPAAGARRPYRARVKLVVGRGRH